MRFAKLTREVKQKSVNPALFPASIKFNNSRRVYLTRLALDELIGELIKLAKEVNK